MSRFPVALSVLVALALVPACKKDSSKGLPPAADWGSGAPATANSGGGTPSPGPNANPHGPGAAATPGNPHAGMDMSGGGGGGDPHAGAMQSKTAPRTLEKLPDGRVALGPFAATPPKEWTEKPVTGSMRAAQYQLSDQSGAEAELVIYYFGDGGAGSVQANLDRWIDQFVQPDGKQSKDVAKVEQTKFGGQEATFVSLTGRYVTTTMPGGGDPIDRKDQAMLAAIVASPKGPYYFKLVGAKKTVDAHAPKFRAMLTSLKVR